MARVGVGGREGWARWLLKVSSNPNHCTILWKEAFWMTHLSAVFLLAMEGEPTAIFNQIHCTLAQIRGKKFQWIPGVTDRRRKVHMQNPAPLVGRNLIKVTTKVTCTGFYTIQVQPTGGSCCMGNTVDASQVWHLTHRKTYRRLVPRNPAYSVSAAQGPCSYNLQGSSSSLLSRAPDSSHRLWSPCHFYDFRWLISNVCFHHMHVHGLP